MVWCPSAGGLETIFAKDDRGAFEGAESMVGEVTALDLLSIESVKAVSAADVKNLLHVGT